MGTGSFLIVEAAGAWGWPPTPHLVPKVLEKGRAIPLLTLKACVAYKKGENLPTTGDILSAYAVKHPPHTRTGKLLSMCKLYRLQFYVN